MLKLIAILPTELNHKINHFLCCVWYLNRIRFNMSNGPTLFPNRMLQINHKKSTALSHNIVNVTRVLKFVRKLSGSQAIHAIDDNLQSICQVIGVVRVSCQISSELPLKHVTSGRIVVVLNSDSSLLNFTKFRSIRPKQIEILYRRRMHRGNIKQCHIRIHTRF